MKRIVLIFTVVFLLLFVLVLFLSFKTLSMKISDFFAARPVNNSKFIEGLEKENSELKSLFASILPNSKAVIYEDSYRNIYKNTGMLPPEPVPVVPLKRVLSDGKEVDFRIALDELDYLRPVYDPAWKMFYYRSWLLLDYKVLEARHRLHAFSIGGSANFDITGSLGFEPEHPPSFSLDNHRNKNLLIFNFEVKQVKVLNDQVALTGLPRNTGVQIISIVQDDLLPEGAVEKKLVFQLATPDGNEIDYLHEHVIQYQYLKQQIEEHSVKPTFDEIELPHLEKLIRENLALKAELSRFIPLENSFIKQKHYESSQISEAKGKPINYDIIYNNSKYRRPVYDPAWKTNYTRKWSYIPEQVENNLHLLHIIPSGKEQQFDFFGIVSFHENIRPMKINETGFLIYNFNVKMVSSIGNQIFIVGTTSRSGAQVMTINKNQLKNWNEYSVSLITPDYYEIDRKTFIR